MIRDDLKAYLASVANLTALVGDGSAGNPVRIYWRKVPSAQKTYPIVAFKKASGGVANDLDGGAGYAVSSFEFAVFDTDAYTCEQTAEALRNALQGYQQQIPATEQGRLMGSTLIRELTLDNESDDCIDPQTSTDRVIYVIDQDYTIHYDISVPSFTGVLTNV